MSLLTYSQLRTALLNRYEQPGLRLPQSRLKAQLDRTVFIPLQTLTDRVERMKAISSELVRNAGLSDERKRELVAEFQGKVEEILVEYQQNLLNIPTEEIVEEKTG